MASFNVIDYVEIATTGNATDFGDLVNARGWVAGLGSSTRAVFGGGNGPVNTIEYVTITSLGNTTNFGDLTVTRGSAAGLSNDTRGLFGGGAISGPGNYSNVIDYITIASTGNATDFGDFTVSVKVYMAGLASPTRGVFGSGHNGSGVDNEINYITIATTGNTTDFGDRTVSKYGPSGTSNGHGGL